MNYKIALVAIIAMLNLMIVPQAVQAGPPVQSNTGPSSTPAWYTQTIGMPGVGSSKAEAILRLGVKNQAVCQKYNENKINQNTIPQLSNFPSSLPSQFDGEKSYCLEEDTSTYNYPYIILKAIDTDVN
jgi:hypothetical protein